MTAPILIVAVGNESRGDDALGPMLLRELGSWINEQGLSTEVELLEEFQLQIENAIDMKDRSRVLFVDAGTNMKASFQFARLSLSDEPVLYSHAVPPTALLRVYEQFYHEAPPASYVCCIAGEQFELGASLSNQALENMALAGAFLKKLLLCPSVNEWDELSQQKSVEDSMRSVDNPNLSAIYQYAK